MGPAHRLFAWSVVFGVLFVASLQGCKDPGDTDTGDTADTDTADTDTGDDTSDTSDTGYTGDSDAACWVDAPQGDCYDCELPETPTEGSLRFLNQCTDSSYAAFDNAARIPSTTWVPGDPLPVIQ